MSRRQKQYERLDRLEDEFLSALKAELEFARAGERELMFCVSRYNPFPELKHHTSSTTEALLDDADTLLQLRKQLDEPRDDSPAARLHGYCRRWSDVEDDHRPGVQRLAEEFLRELV